MKLGFLINPIAGMGGKVGLKGTDNIAGNAIRMGAKPIAPARAREFLNRLKTLEFKEQLEIITCPASMGQEEVEAAGFSAEVLRMGLKSKTTADDTKNAVRLMAEKKADIVVFVGGDGTARDILDALLNVKIDVPVLGVPSGVKMYSGIFAVNPSDAAVVVEAFAKKEAELTEFEIMDTNEAGIRRDQFNVRLYGFLSGPSLSMRIQGSKQISAETLDEHENQLAIARFIVESMNSDGTYILGPGTTVKCVADLLGVEKTLLGVDLYKKGKLVRDVNEAKLLNLIESWRNTWIILSPIGRQGVLFGRGNQQISPEIIRHIGKERIIVGATPSKLRGIESGVLRVDTGVGQVNDMLRGYMRVVTDYKEWRLVRVQ
ncbi:MAG TPA: ATP-NAD kinase family protein [Candidatus Bathyarchaeia archaeon]|nr:ATP-NAD kinase family protein [Candidatus Bathyarchaeia archaeon]